MLRQIFAGALLLALAALTGPAAAQGTQEMPEAPASVWRPADDHLTFISANIDVPRAAGAV